MKLLNKLRLLTNRIVKPAGFEVTRINRSTMEHGLARLPGKWNIKSVLDIGAARGDWTALAGKAMPDAQFVMVEALEERRGELEAVAARNPTQLRAHIGAIGEKNGEVEFLVTPNLDGSGAVRGAVQKDQVLRRVPMITVDTLVEQYGLKAPYLLKLDTHGYEVPILEGATRTLEQAPVVILEVYTIRPANDPRLLFWETCDYMAKHGFRCFDVVDPLVREKDGVLWQMDFFFTKADWPNFKDASWL